MYSVPLAVVIERFYGYKNRHASYTYKLYFKNEELYIKFLKYSIDNPIKSNDDLIFVEDVFDLNKTDSYILHFLYAFSDGNIFRSKYNKKLSGNMKDIVSCIFWYCDNDVELMKVLKYFVKIIPDEMLYDLVDCIYENKSYEKIKYFVLKELGNKYSLVENYIKLKYTV